MKPGLHFDPKHTTTYTANRTTQRILIAFHTLMNLHLKHFDIYSAYLHERYAFHKPFYVKQKPTFDEIFIHDGKYGKRIGNLYASPPAAYYYSHSLKKYLTSLGFKTSENDTCLYTKATKNDGFIIFSTTIDTFLVLASTQPFI